MNKKAHDFRELEKTIEQLRKLSTETILHRLTLTITSVAAKACKIILKERGIEK